MSGLLIPDFGAIFDRADAAKQSRIQALALQRQADEEGRFSAALPGIAAGLGSSDPNVRGGALSQLAGFRQGLPVALPMIEQARGANELAAALRPAGAPPAAPMPGVRAEPLPPTQAGGAGQNELDLVARVLYGEAGGESEEGLRAAAHVINNRARLTGMTPAQVVAQRGQFEAFGNPETRARLMQLPPDRLARARAIAERVFGGGDQDPTQGATHFLNPVLQASMGRQQPAWAPEGQGTRIGNHVFYARPGDFRPVAQNDAAPGGQAPSAGPGRALEGGQLPGGDLGIILRDPEAYGRVATIAGGTGPGAAAAQRLLQAAQPFLERRNAGGQGSDVERLFARWRELSAMPNPSPQDVQERDMLAARLRGGGTNVTVEGAPQIGTIPPGFQVVRDGNTLRMEPIPGGPADAANRREQRTEESRRQNQQRQAGLVFDEIRRIETAIDNARLPVTGFGGAILSRLPGTAAADVRQLLDTLRAESAFSQLAQMRAESPTGAALGQVTERELALLQATAGSLEQSQTAQQFRDNLIRLENTYLDIIHGQGQGPQRRVPSFARGDARPPIESFGR